MKKTIPFEIHKVYQQEVARLVSSRAKSHLIHSSGDIDASGDEVEAPLRDLLRRRLPNQFFVGHGHIVDASLNVSPQFDVIIADNNATPILFEAENGCQYFPWESVYAVGEVKASFLKAKRPFTKFAESIGTLKQTLTRAPTPTNYLGNGVSLGDMFSTSDTRSTRNPLFQFIVFFDSNGATREDIAGEFAGKPDQSLPTVSVFLDGSVIVKAELIEVPEGIGMGAIDLDPLRVTERKETDWMHVNYTSPDAKGAQALVVLVLALSSHLNSCVLMTPKIDEYLKPLMRGARINRFLSHLEVC